MLILLSPSKTIHTNAEAAVVSSLTIPLFASQAQALAHEMSGYLPSELAELLKVQPSIAAQAHQWFQVFCSADTPNISAIDAYHGIVFQYLDAPSLPNIARQRLIERLRITSFLYGYLRPSDAIHPYRMEGHVRTQVGNGQTIFDYWKGWLTDRLIKDVNEQGGILLFLASEEMKKLFDWKRVTASVQVIQPTFLTNKNGKEKQIVVYTKMMRGKLCRHALLRNWKGSEKEMQQFANEEEAALRKGNKKGEYTFVF